jgi:hypothetical protein
MKKRTSNSNALFSKRQLLQGGMTALVMFSILVAVVVILFVSKNGSKVLVGHFHSKQENISETNGFIFQVNSQVIAKTSAEENQAAVSSMKPKEAKTLPNESQESRGVSCSFTYLKPGENIPQLAPAFLSLTSRNPAARIYNKVAKLAQLQRELDGLLPISLIQLRPMSMSLEYSSKASEGSALQVIEADLDFNLARLNKMLTDNPVDGSLTPLH